MLNARPWFPGTRVVTRDMKIVDPAFNRLTFFGPAKSANLG
ncbi:MAG: hypothetical protein ACT4N2_00560 [Hyphomicrobium sp.]